MKETFRANILRIFLKAIGTVFGIKYGLIFFFQYKASLKTKFFQIF